MNHLHRWRWRRNGRCGGGATPPHPLLHPPEFAAKPSEGTPSFWGFCMRGVVEMALDARSRPGVKPTEGVETA